MSKSSKKVVSKSPISKASNKKPLVKKAAYVSREEYKSKFELQMALAGKNESKLTVIKEANHQLNRTLTGEIKKVVEARKQYSNLITKYDHAVLKLNNSENRIVDFESAMQVAAMKSNEFENLSTFRKVIIVITDSVSNFTK